MFVFLSRVYTFTYKNLFLNNFLYEKTFFIDDDAHLRDFAGHKLSRR